MQYNRQEMSQQFKKDEMFNRNKRLAFAQEIRTRDRHRKIQQLRTDIYMKQKVRKWLENSHVDSFSLYNYMRQLKIQQANAAVVVGEWLATAKPDLVIENKMDNMRWGYILATVLEYRHEYLEMVLGTYLQVIIEECRKYNDYQVLYIVMASAVTSADISQVKGKRHNNNNSNSMQMQDRYQQLLSQSISKCLQLRQPSQYIPDPTQYPQPSPSLQLHQLKFYNICFMPYTKQMLHITQNQHFIHILIRTLDNSIDNPQMMRECLRLLISISYYDDSEYEDSDRITHVLVEKGVLGSVKFILEFVGVEQEVLLCFAMMLLGNIAQNVGMLDIFESGVLGHIRAIIEAGGRGGSTNTQHQHTSHTSQSKHNYTRNTIRHACLCYLTLIQQVSNTQHQLKQLRQLDTIPFMLQIINNHAQHNTQIVLIAYHAFQKILSIGQQIRQNNNSDINPYSLAIKYHQGVDIFKCHHKLYELVEEYDIL